MASPHKQPSPNMVRSWLKYFVLLFCLKYIEGSLSFRCDYKYNSEANGWFKHHVVPATWFDARLRCALEGAVLASPTTQIIKTVLTKITNSTESEQGYEIFTGIHATFAQGAYATVDGIPLSKIPKTWAPNEPDNKDNKESCLTMNFNGDLADLSCEATRPYVCYRSANNRLRVNECGTTDPEYRLDARTNSCYKFHTIAKNFTRAFFTCDAEGGYLAIINSEIESTVLKQLFSSHPGGSMRGDFWKDVAFVGFHDWGERWDFRTIHGQTMEEAGFGKFSGGEPNNFAPGESCGSIYRSALFNDLWCDRSAAFICEKDPDYPEICHSNSKEHK